MDPLSESRLAPLHPALQVRIRALAEQLSQENIEIKVIQGLRTWEEQDELYAEGRTLPGRIVTEARGGYSWHNYGLACDVAPFDEGIPDWDVSHPAWKRIIELGEVQGLLSGSSFHRCPDNPHFQFTGVLPESPDDATREVYKTSGIAGVWEAARLS